MRNIAAATSGDENLGANLFRAIEDDNSALTIGVRHYLGRENRGCQPGSSRTNHCNIMYLVVYRH